MLTMLTYLLTPPPELKRPTIEGNILMNKLTPIDPARFANDLLYIIKDNECLIFVVVARWRSWAPLRPLAPLCSALSLICLL